MISLSLIRRLTNTWTRCEKSSDASAKQSCASIQTNVGSVWTNSSISGTSSRGHMYRSREGPGCRTVAHFKSRKTDSPVFGLGLLVSAFHPGFCHRRCSAHRAYQQETRPMALGSRRDAFEQIKATLTTSVLACPDFSRRFFLQTDTSASGLGAVLTQNFPEGERVIAYASRTLNAAEKNYSATELECLAVIWGIRRMRDYLEGYPFTIITNHQSLRWLQKLNAPAGRLGRWAFELQQFDIEIKYRRRSLNRVADAMSRQSVTAAAAAPLKCE